MRMSSKERQASIEEMPESDKSKFLSMQREVVTFRRLGVRFAARIFTFIVNYRLDLAGFSRRDSNA